jgi:hypothetical protein
MLLIELSGKKNRIIAAITGNRHPIKNHNRGERPILLAKRAVTSGIVSRKIIPIDIKITIPIYIIFFPNQN